MATTQMNITKSIPYKTDYPIKHNRFLQIVGEGIRHEEHTIRDLGQIEDDYKFYIDHSRYYQLYAHHALLDYFLSIKLITRNMDFRNFKSLILSDIINGVENWYDPYIMAVSKMITAGGYKLRFFKLSECNDLIVQSIGAGLPVTLDTYHTIDENSEGFFNNILVFGIVRGDKGEIVGVTGHDYAGNANTNYQNKNGNNIVYHGELFKKITKNSMVGIPVEEDT
jgi:hypothetical protein